MIVPDNPMPQPSDLLLKRVQQLEKQIHDLRKELKTMEKRVVHIGIKYQERQSRKMADLIKSRISMLGKG